MTEPIEVFPYRSGATGAFSLDFRPKPVVDQESPKDAAPAEKFEPERPKQEQATLVTEPIQEELDFGAPSDLGIPVDLNQILEEPMKKVSAPAKVALPKI